MQAVANKMKEWRQPRIKAWHPSYVARLKRTWERQKITAQRAANAVGGVPSAASTLMDAQSERSKMESAARLCGKEGHATFAQAAKERCVRCVCESFVQCGGALVWEEGGRSLV